ncbi:modin [Purpureocillium lavendulum]|uniref:Modin n=1 Tax=Purpureocillium lavendulum TaxID=1247861 RepID=A0AB34FL12_9HYPO|nr:modin [Purpureocillium lavendulum]
MRVVPPALALLAASAASISSASTVQHVGRDDHKKNDDDIFPNFNSYSDWAICKNKVTPKRFPGLQAPRSGGCVRYYRGIDMTGVVTELHFYFKDGFKSACDCVAKCLESPTSCNNWVWKHTFMDGDDGKRSCTLYSSPNLPSNVTLDYDLTQSSGFEPLDPDENPQVGGESPLTFLDPEGTKPDEFGVSGFTAQDQNGALYC